VALLLSVGFELHFPKILDVVAISASLATGILRTLVEYN